LIYVEKIKIPKKVLEFKAGGHTGISACPLNFCNKKQKTQAGIWVAGIARFRIYNAFFIRKKWKYI